MVVVLQFVHSLRPLEESVTDWAPLSSGPVFIPASHVTMRKLCCAETYCTDTHQDVPAPGLRKADVSITALFEGRSRQWCRGNVNYTNACVLCGKTVKNISESLLKTQLTKTYLRVFIYIQRAISWRCHGPCVSCGKWFKNISESLSKTQLTKTYLRMFIISWRVMGPVFRVVNDLTISRVFIQKIVVQDIFEDDKSVIWRGHV